MAPPPIPLRTTLPRRLLLVSCSAKKNTVAGSVPAWHLYDGVAYRVLKRALRADEWPEDLDIVILSAKYGLIEPDAVIETYDEIMTPDRAQRIQHVVHGKLARLVESRPYEQLLVFAGQDYLRALRLSPIWLPRRLIVEIAGGGIGRKLHWLRSQLSTGADTEPL
jgi:hypothetical protein